MTRTLSERRIYPVHAVCMTVEADHVYITKLGYPYNVIQMFPTVKECMEHVIAMGWYCAKVFTD